jgi:hypothetical protein
MRQLTGTGRPRLAWTVAAIAIVVLMVATIMRSGGGETETPALTRGDVLEELVDLGYLPNQALETGDIYTHGERVIIDAVNSGMIPRQTLDEDNFVLKGIIDRLVPKDQ